MSKIRIVFVVALTVVSLLVLGCGAPAPVDEGSPAQTVNTDAKSVQPSYYLGDGQYAVSFVNDPQTGKRCIIVTNNGGGASVNGAAPSVFCYD